MIDIQYDKKRVFVETYGCQMNVYDTELVRSILLKAGYSFVAKEQEADIALLNTCAIREHAHQKVYNRIHEIRRCHQGKSVVIGVLGCMATNLRTDLLENRRLNIDFIAGPDSYKRLPELIAQCVNDEKQWTGDKRRKAYDVRLSEFETYADVYPERPGGVNAWLAVMRGCNNFCTFCVVPYTRGRERSRAPENVVAEVRRLGQEGFKQVTLLGQNVNSYYYQGHDFADLIEEVSRVETIERIRFTSPHPKDFPEKLLNVIARHPKICKHIHLPVQSGSNRILERMGRTYTREDFLELVAKIQRIIPGVALSTDVIVGFCAETDADFEDTLSLMREVEFDSAFTFKYSQRKGTIASRQYKDDVFEAIKTERIVSLNALQKEISLKKNRAYISHCHEILIENKGNKHSPDILYGRTDDNKLVTLASGNHGLGEFVKVRIVDVSANVLKGVAI